MSKVKDFDGDGDIDTDDENLYRLFQRFTNSSTVHGTYFWGSENRSVLGKLLWICIVVTGIVMSAMIINNSFIAWKLNPVITSVAQIPIEQVPFPSITICPRGNTGFGFVEQTVNQLDSSEFDLSSILLDALITVRNIQDQTHSKETRSCLLKACSEPSSSAECLALNTEHVAYMVDALAANSTGVVDDLLVRHVEQLISDKLAPDEGEGRFGATIPIKRQASEDGAPSCEEVVHDLVFLQTAQNLLENASRDRLLPGPLLRWIYGKQDQYSEERRKLFEAHLPQDRFPELYASSLGSKVHLPLPELVEVLTDVDAPTLLKERTVLRDIGFSEKLLQVMRLSLHPPHVVEEGDKFDFYKVPNAAFPFCWYQDELGEGARYGPYNESYCQGFQTTVNEVGICYTFNNFDLGMDAAASTRPLAVRVRHVKGCGKSKGLRVILDSHHLATHPLFSQSSGFTVFVTVPGVVTHKVPFNIDPSFHGENSIYLHGIHYIDASQDFKEWNKENKVCYFPHDKNLSYFSQYTQDNCLLECRCFQTAFDQYQDDITDRVDCDCRNDCGGIHIFSSLGRYPFSDQTDTDMELLWDEASGSGRLANYLLDPAHVFGNDFSTNLTFAAFDSGQTNATQRATRRFNSDISVLNFFFDTPIITRITLEMRITIFDQISAIGGTLGLFTGVSIITFVELVYWFVKFIWASMRRAGKVTSVGGAGIGLSSQRAFSLPRRRSTLAPIKPLSNSVIRGGYGVQY